MSRYTEDLAFLGIERKEGEGLLALVPQGSLDEALDIQWIVYDPPVKLSPYKIW